MKIVAGKTLKAQPKQFVDMVTNAKEGDLYIHSFSNSIVFSYDVMGVPQSALFLVESVEDITTRFGSRDRILRGWRCKPGADGTNDVIKIEKSAKWCSQLATTDKYPGKYTLK